MLVLKKTEISARKDPDPKSTPFHYDFKNSYLELIRLLNEAAGLEHLLMLQYLYAGFSIKPKYIQVRGSLNDHFQFEKCSIFGVAIEEMRHLKMVNEFLFAIGASPNMSPHTSAEVSEIYPFDLQLTPLNQQSTAMYLFVEADSCALNLKCSHTKEEITFIKSVNHALGTDPKPNHIGSLYGTILKYAKECAADPPDFLKRENVDWNKFTNYMLSIKDEGEKDHFDYFKKVFTATHKGFDNNSKVWQLDPSHPDYPSIQFLPRQTAYKEKYNHIQSEDIRKIAWLSNLHYWIILELLDLNYRTQSMKPKYKAIGNMTEALFKLGEALAEKKIGVPFDQSNIRPNAGKTAEFCVEILVEMIREAEAHAKEIKDLLPGFNMNIYSESLRGLTKDISSG